MPYKPHKGGTLLIPSGSNANPDSKHLFVILNDACPQSQHALVSISTIRLGQYHDPSCIIDVGEHEFVREKSFVKYQMARLEKSDHLIKCVAGWTFTEKPPVSETLLVRIIAGVELSDFTPKFVQDYVAKLA